jgi:hypothetical protein
VELRELGGLSVEIRLIPRRSISLCLSVVRVWFVAVGT